MKCKGLVVLILLSGLVVSACQNKKPPVTTPVTTPTTTTKKFQTVFFDYDKSLVRDDQIGSLDNNGGILRDKSDLTVTIEGHCDERGTNEYNLALGDRRARSVQNYLTNLGIDPSRLTIISYGEERPTSNCHDESCWWQNRRAEFIK